MPKRLLQALRNEEWLELFLVGADKEASTEELLIDADKAAFPEDLHVHVMSPL